MSSTAAALKLENVLYEKKGPVAYVTINRPKVLNALNAKTISELRSAFEDARDDSAMRGVVFTGAGISRLLPARISAKWPTILRSRRNRKRGPAKRLLTLLKI
jgi:hypothetical protein